MTHLNWQRSDLNRVQSDYCGDDLPRIGSRADIARQLDALEGNEWHRDSRSPTVSRSGRRHTPPSSPGMANGRDADAQQLKAYIANASSSDFGRRPAVQRADVVRALLVLSRRLYAQSAGTATSRESAMLAQASTLVARWRVTR